MAVTLANLLLDVQFHANDSQFSAAQGSAALRIVNEAYQDFATLRKWPELDKVDTSLTTVAGQEAYTWPITLIWKDEPTINIKRINQQNYPYRMNPCPSEDMWAQVRRTGNSFPYYYRRYRTGTTDTLLLRPITAFTGDIIEIWGPTEITEFVGDGSAADTTPFMNTQSDRALAMWIAMFLKLQRKDVAGAQVLRQQATGILPARQFTPVYRQGELQPWQG